MGQNVVIYKQKKCAMCKVEQIYSIVTSYRGTKFLGNPSGMEQSQEVKKVFMLKKMRGVVICTCN